MGCALTKTEDEHNSLQPPVLKAAEFSVFVPGIRLPRRLEAGGVEHEEPVQRLMSYHSTLVSAVEELVFPKKLRKNKPFLSGSSLMRLREAIEDYLAVLLRLQSREPRLANQISFTWTNQEDEIKVQETSIRSPYYEILSLLQLLATLSLIEANKALVFKPPGVEEHHQARIMDDNKRTAMDVLFKAAEVLEHALVSVLEQAPRDVRDQLPADLTRGVLHALQLQALGQTVEIQLGLAIDNPKATMAVKRRLACEQLKYWQLAYENLQSVHLGNGWGEKHLLFVRWKGAEAKAAAYHFHGLILNESSEERRAAASLGASEHFFKESERICKDFSATAPMTKLPVGRPLSWGPMKYLSEKIHRDVVSATTAMTDDRFHDKVIRKLELPDFPLALQVDEYQPAQAQDDDQQQQQQQQAADSTLNLI